MTYYAVTGQLCCVFVTARARQQIGQALTPRNLWPREHVRQPLLVFSPVAAAGRLVRRVVVALIAPSPANPTPNAQRAARGRRRRRARPPVARTRGLSATG